MRGRPLSISHAKTSDRRGVLAFQERHGSEFIWPRTEEEFAKLTDDRALFVVKDGDEVVGVCYVKQDQEHWEFGGVMIDAKLQGRGLAVALGRCAIASVFLAWDTAHELIAHVHIENDAPRRVLTEHLGFQPTGETVSPPPHVAPSSMKRNEQGEVVGDLYRFDPSALVGFADWFESFTGVLEGKGGTETELRLDVAVADQALGLVEQLRTMAA